MRVYWPLGLSILAACSMGVEQPEKDSPGSTTQQPLGSFVGILDSSTGDMRIVPADRVSELGTEAKALWAELDVDQNGIRGRGPRGTVEVSTIPSTAGFGPPRCAPNEVCGMVQIGSRLSAPVTNLTAYIKRISPMTGVRPRAGNEPGSFMGLDNARGLFVYRETVPAWSSGLANFTSPKMWSFERFFAGNVFVFGTVYGDVGLPNQVCGDGRVSGTETCDPQNEVGCGTGMECLNCQCTAIACGDGRVSPGEACDPQADSNACATGTACNSDCACAPVCGDGIIASGEACDFAADVNGCNPGVVCDEACTCVPVCGNTFVEAGEQCDDGNTNDGDGCSATCQFQTICGNAVVENGEGCDDGNGNSGDGCSACLVDDGWMCQGSPSECTRLTLSCVSWGDTHVTTFDGLMFDFQQVGEFVHAIDGDANDLEVQARLAPYGNSTVVSINAAVAARIGDADKVEVYPGANGHLMLLNGVPTDLGNHLLPDGGIVDNVAGSVTVTWPAGDVLVIFDRGTYLDFTLYAIRGRALNLHGLCGEAGEGMENDFTKRDGSIIPQPLSITQLYSNWGASWRLRGGESLFTYGKGESTETFTDLAFPSEHVNIASLTPAQYNAGLTACTAGGIPAGAVLDACIVDVGVSGSTGFVESSTGVEQPAAAADTGPKLATCVSWGDTHMTSQDGIGFDFQQVGEWISAANQDHSFMVQTRQAQWGGQQVAVNTQVAARVGADRVTFDRAGVVRVNGSVVTPPVFLAGGDIQGSSGQYFVRWNEGDRLDVACRGGYVDYLLGVVETRVGTLGGLCGFYDADVSNDFTTRDGRSIPNPTTLQLYDDFGDSWRVVDADPPLFDYGPGETTATYTDLLFPSQYLTTTTLPQADRDAAEAACRAAGVTAPDLLAACILDVGATSDTGFTESSGSVPPPPAGALSGYFSNFESAVGSEWSNPTVSTTPGSPTHPSDKFLGRFGNETVDLSFNSLRPHTEVTVSFDLYVIESWDGNTSPGPDQFKLSYTVGGITRTLLHTTFANLNVGQAYPDGIGGNHPGRTGALENNTLGFPFFGDSVYRLTYTIPSSSPDIVVHFAGINLQGVSDESWGLDNVSVSLRSAPPVPMGTPPESVSYSVRQACGSYCYFDEPHDNAVGNDVTPFAASQLMDGVYGVDDWTANLGNGNAYEWVGWASVDPVMIFKFPGIRTFHDVIMGTSRYQASGIYLPGGIGISFSDDGVNFGPVHSFVPPQIPDGTRGDLVYDVGSESGQYVMIQVAPGGTWSFFDEVVFQ